MGEAGIREALRGRLQTPPPDPVGDVAVLFAEQVLQVAQRHADRRRETGGIERRVAQVGLDMGHRALEDEDALDVLR